MARHWRGNGGGPGRTFKTCKFCNEGGFVWYQHPVSGRFQLAHPIEGTMQPDSTRLHDCPKRQQQEGQQQEEAKPTDEVQLVCRGCGMVLTTQRRFLTTTGVPICPKDEQFFEEGVPLELAAL